MTVLLEWNFKLDVDGVLRGQGADPEVLRQRSPHLVEAAARAIEEGTPLLRPAVLCREVAVQALQHERLLLRGGGRLSGPLIARHLGRAEKVVAVLCTIGSELEGRVAEAMSSNMVHGLALDGVGSAAVEALAQAACQRLAAEAALEGLSTTMSLSPGMVGWPVDEGQPEVFDLLDGARIGVTLTQSCLMIPRKSLSFVVGVGREVGQQGQPCDYCSMRETCLYRSDHE